MIMTAKYADLERGENLRKRVMQLNNLDEARVILWCPAGYPLAGHDRVKTLPRYPFTYNGQENWAISTHKMVLWGQTQYDVIVSMDLDMVPAQPFAELLSAPGPVSITYGMESFTYPYGLNGGLLVIHPNARLYRWMLRQPQSGNDQELIAQLLLGKGELVLSHVYNMNPVACLALQKAFGLNQQRYVKIWHFTNGIAKPWELVLEQVPLCARDAWSKLYHNA